MSAYDPNRIPVIIGTGQINDRPDDSALGLDSFQLMERALRLAEEDAGGGWLASLDSLSVVAQISFPELGNAAALLVDQMGLAPRHIEQTPYPTGESPVQLLNEAANRIAVGEIEVAAIAGAEALRTAARRAREGRADALRNVAAKAAPSLRHVHGLVAPTDLYPLYENATRAAWGQSLAEGQAETGALWAGLSKVAAGNPTAWLRTACSAEEIVTPSADNRPIAFPYTKLMVANSSVNQGAAFLVTSLARARAAGIADDRLVFVGAGAAAHERGDILKRDRYDRSMGMIVTLEQTLALNGLEGREIDLVELYSCFPCIPKMARRILDWPLDKPISRFGGLTFGGGPIGNYMSHAIGSMVDAMRRGEGERALLFANGGYATHNHAIVLGREPMATGLPFDCNAQAEARREAVPGSVERYEGAATIETYTVFHDREGAARFGTIIARTADGARVLAKVPGDETGMLTDGVAEPVGMGGRVIERDGVSHWQSG